MRFEWDERKNRGNRRKHRISFELAVEVFNDPLCLTIPDQIVDGEERLWTLGSVGGENIVVVVVHTIRDEGGEEIIRVLSARKATPRERKFYEADK